MNYILMILFLFYIGSIFGWVLELFFRRIISKERKWVNPGFLIGPYLPLYGFGLTTLFLLACCEVYIPIESAVLRKAILFLVMALMMTVLEYMAGLIFIKKMKVKLWDYSNMRGNIQGIICPLYSFFWAVLGAIYYLCLHSYVAEILKDIFNSTLLAFMVGIFYGFFIIDLVYSLQLMVKIRTFAKENRIVVKLEEFKMNIIKNAEEKKKKWKFIFTLPSNSSMTSQLQKYNETRKKLEAEIKKISKCGFKGKNKD